MSVSASVLLVSLLIGIGSLAKPLAERMRTPLSIVHAAVGIGIGVACLAALRDPGLPLPADLASFVAEMPVSSDLFLYGLLPTLLFQSALSVDLHRIREDFLPILLLALLAVVLVTLCIGLALWPLAGMPLVACLLLASIVATTDPVAVISIFRSVGAPDHLLRLVEGESLFNDAAAIAIFVACLGILVAPQSLSVTGIALDFLVLPTGGAVLGIVTAWLAVAATRLFPGDRIGAASLSLVLPYLTFLAAAALDVSGVIAVVAASVTLATLAPGRIAGDTWRYLRDVWDLLADSAGVLVFILTSILVPRLLGGAGWRELGLLAVVFTAALAARALMLCGAFPLLSRFSRSLDVSARYRIVAVWGGLRGSMTLVLALAVTENPAVPRDVAAFVATLATGFTLATLFIHGTTLRPLMRRLQLDTLTEVDRRVRDLALTLAASNPGPRAAPAPRPRLDPATAIAIALVAATAREREIVLDHFDSGTVESRAARRLVAAARRRLDLARVWGAAGYAAADAEELRFPPLDRLAVALQQRLGWAGLLATRLETRCQVLLETALVADGLPDLVRSDVEPMLGEDTAREALLVLDRRRAALEREIEALRLQYPAYTAEVERRMASRAASAIEAARVARMRRVGIISGDVERALRAEIARRAASEAARPRLDLGLDPRRLVASCELFDALTEAQKDAVARRLRPVLAVPGMRLIRKGERGAAAYFISSGAVEVDLGGTVQRLGRGDAFGEMALIYDIRRQADVTAIAYCQLLRLDAADFRYFLDRQPALRARLEALADRRLQDNTVLAVARA